MTVWGVDLPPAAIAGFLSAFIALAAVMLVWLQWRERQFRKDDVLKWSNEVIRALQTLYLVASLAERGFDAKTAKALLRAIAIDTSVLVEQGRLFFRNASDPEHGKDKYPAYRGYRPELLDPIVIAHQIACEWEQADREARQRMALVAEDGVRRFVSLAQKEVGRSRTVSRETAKGGKGLSLAEMMTAVGEPRLKSLGDGQQ